MRFWILPFFAFFCASSIHSETIILDREKTVQIALAKNETYGAVLLEKDRIRGQYLEARSNAFPRISFDGTYLRSIDLSTTVFSITEEDGTTTTSEIRFGTPHNFILGLSLYQPLYSAGRVGAALKIAKYGSLYNKAEIATSRHDIATEADKAYLDAIAAREAEHVYAEAERLADSNLAVVKKLYDQGEVSEFDLLRAQVQAANSRPPRIASANQARLALDYLRNILALPSETDILVGLISDEIKLPALELQPLITEALQNRPELRQTEQLVGINKKRVDIAKSGYRPSFGINSRVQWDSFVDEIGKSSISSSAWNRSWNVAVVMNWPLFSGFETVGQVQQARVDFKQSQLQSSQLVRQIKLEVREALGRVDESRQRVEAIGEAVGQALRGVEIGRVRFESGEGTQLELLDTQVALTTSRVNKISALHDLTVAVSALRRAVGREWAPLW